MTKDFVSLITVNFNGKKYLKDFLDSAFALDYPKDKYEVVVVDNGSTDGSVDFVKNKYPKARIIESKKNLGFGGGNNLGMKNTKGDLCFLVNNDTVLDKKVLKNIVATFARWSMKGKVGAVNAKMIFIDNYLPFRIEEALYSSYKLSGGKPINPEPFVIPHETSSRFIEKVFIPIDHKLKGSLDIVLNIKPLRKSEMKIFLGQRPMLTTEYKKTGREYQLKISLTKDQLHKLKKDLIQNAGNYYFRDGHGRDRGAVVMKQRQYYELDRGQYNKEEIIPGFCGAGVLLNKKALKRVGYFDERFFMYYEDSDLSLRLKEAGWQIVYSPQAVIRHIHSGSSKEWSSFFIFHAERGRLLLLSKHWPRMIAISQWLKYLARDTIGIPFYYLVKKDFKNAKTRLAIRAKVNISMFPNFILGLAHTKRMSKKQVERLS